MSVFDVITIMLWGWIFHKLWFVVGFLFFEVYLRDEPVCFGKEVKGVSSLVRCQKRGKAFKGDPTNKEEFYDHNESNALNEDDIAHLFVDDIDESIKKEKKGKPVEPINLPGVPKHWEWIYNQTDREHPLIQDIIKDNKQFPFNDKQWGISIEAIRRLYTKEQVGKLVIPTKSDKRIALRKREEQEIKIEELEVEAYLVEVEAEEQRYMSSLCFKVTYLFLKIFLPWKV